MLRRVGGEWGLYPHKVKYKRKGDATEKWALPSKEWWEEICEKHDHLELAGFEEIELTDEQQARFEEIKTLRLGEGHRTALIDYVLDGELTEDGPEPLRWFRLQKEREQQNDRIAALERAAGVGQDAERGIARRIDELEDKLAEYEQRLEE